MSDVEDDLYEWQQINARWDASIMVLYDLMQSGNEQAVERYVNELRVYYNDEAVASMLESARNGEIDVY